MSLSFCQSGVGDIVGAHTASAKLWPFDELKKGVISMSDRELGGAGSYVIFENEHVRVLQNDLNPGESSDWHLHENHYLFLNQTK